MTWILVLAINFGIDNPVVFHISFDTQKECEMWATNPDPLLEEIMGDSDWEVTTRCHAVYTGKSYQI